LAVGTEPNQRVMHVGAGILSQQLQLADLLLAGRDRMLEPQDLPGRYGRVVEALDQVLAAVDCEAVVGGVWAVWRHGYVGRVTQDIDLVLPAAKIDEFKRVASVSGFDVFTESAGRWQELTHRETGIAVDVLPEGGRPGVAGKSAPTTIPHPSKMGATHGKLSYASLASLVELKLAAGRLRDQADVLELIRENREQIESLRTHLEAGHEQYANRFDELLGQLDESAAE
jgi:hypothetical protein